MARRGVQQREDQRTDEEQEAERACPECGGSVVADSERGETVCEECGLVVEDDNIDRGPEWR
ncbi:MAG: TFIIB-type zinc ribbon-containing protein, partial [Haloarculaceae archaeon]